MKRIKPPQNGPKFNRAHEIPKDDLVSVSESHEEHLVVCYPKLAHEIVKLKAAPVPASFKTVPGKVTGERLVQLGVPGICPECFKFAYAPNPDCKKHPKIPGGGNSWLLKAA